jgi:hypothetical protein
MKFEDLLTKQDMEAMINRIEHVIANSKGALWPMRMKKKTAAQYINTSLTQIEKWVNAGILTTRIDNDPNLYPTTPAYFNKEDLDKIRLT